MDRYQISEKLDNFFKEMIYQDWMTQQEYDSILEQTFEAMNLTKEDLIDQTIIGVNNGYSVETQLNMIRMVFNYKLN